MGDESVDGVLETARQIREGERAAVEVVEACLARIAAGDDVLNAVVHLDRDAALGAAAAVDAARARGDELGPLAGKATRSVRINSTCTVFAGAELRDRLSLGEKREDILAGLHRAIVLRAMSLLARSGGVSDEFTFTGGVAKNSEAVKALRDLIAENYGERTINISPDSIYTGALGAALFALHEALKAEGAAA